MSKLLTHDEVISRFKEVHGNTYDYSKVKYTGSHELVTITCTEHGDFTKSPAHHIKHKQGCPVCTNKKRAKDNKWSYTSWKKAGETSPNFDSYKVYIIMCYNDEGERFYKIGKTFTTVEQRFLSKSFPYNYKVLKVIEGNAYYVSKLEVKLQNLNKDNKYLPKYKFKGMHECFSTLKKETYE